MKTRERAISVVIKAWLKARSNWPSKQANEGGTDGFVQGFLI